MFFLENRWLYELHSELVKNNSIQFMALTLGKIESSGINSIIPFFTLNIKSNTKTSHNIDLSFVLIVIYFRKSIQDLE
jgi:hypothetical protein